MREVGALLDAKAVHGGRSAYNHLLCLAQTNNLPKKRVDEVLDLVGLSEVTRKRSKGFSLGMSQRLGIAATMLGDPEVLMFDEPVNGLDPEGILWIRNLMKALAAEGRTVFVSSHLMSEMENTAEHLIVIGKGKLIADGTMNEFIARSSGAATRVRTPSPDQLALALAAKGGAATAGATARCSCAGDHRRDRRHRLRAGHPGTRTERAPCLARGGVHGTTADSVEYHAGVPGRPPASEAGSDMVTSTAPALRLSTLPPVTGRAGLAARSARSSPAALGPLHLLDDRGAVHRQRRRRGHRRLRHRE